MNKNALSLTLATITTLTSSMAFACMHMMPRDYYATYPLDYSVAGVLLATIVAFVMRCRDASRDRMLAWWCSSIIAGVGFGFFVGTGVKLQLSGFLFVSVVAAVPSLLVVRARTRLGAVIPLLFALFIAGLGTAFLWDTRRTYETGTDFEYHAAAISEDVVF